MDTKMPYSGEDLPSQVADALHLQSQENKALNDWLRQLEAELDGVVGTTAILISANR